MASHGTDQLLVQRLLGCRTRRESQKALMLDAVVILLQFAFFLFLGLCLYALYNGASLAVLGLKSTDEIFPKFIVENLPLTEAKRIPGTDGRKMSKSYANAISLKDDPETVRQKLRPMLTDPARKRRTDPGNPEVCPVFDLHRAFSPPTTREWAAAGCGSAGIGCLDCKAKLAEHVLERLAGIHARRPEFARRPDTVWDILLEGSSRAREVAEATLQEVRADMKIGYPRS